MVHLVHIHTQMRSLLLNLDRGGYNISKKAAIYNSSSKVQSPVKHLLTKEMTRNDYERGCSSMKRLVSLFMCIIICLFICTASATTKGEETALSAAKNYLNFMNFSYQGLYKQLEFDGYSSSECKYAADNCGADWYDQAAGSADNYMSFMAFSKKSLIEQLEYDGYTKEEAEYGAAVAYDENPAKPMSTKNDSKKQQLSPSSTDVPELTNNPDEGINLEIWSSGKMYDMSALSYEELLSVQKSVTKEIISRPEWKEVKVPAGVWIIGQDIPAGSYSIMPENLVTLKFYENTETTYWDYYILESGEGLGKIELKEGMKIDLNGSVVFAPPKGLGF